MSVRFCQHVKVDGTLCQVPPLNGRPFCHFHIDNLGRRIRMARARARRETYHLVLPVLEDLNSVQVARQQVMDAMLSGQLDQKLGGRLLFGLQGVASDFRGPKPPRLTEYDPTIDTAPRATEYVNFERDYDLPRNFDLSRPPEVIFAEEAAPSADRAGTEPAATSTPADAAPGTTADTPPKPVAVVPVVAATMDAWAMAAAVTPAVDSAMVVVPASPMDPAAILGAAAQICRRQDKYPMVTGLEVELEHLRQEDPEAYQRRLQELQRVDMTRHRREQRKLQKARYLVEADERNRATEELAKADLEAFEQQRIAQHKLQPAAEEGPAKGGTSAAWAIPNRVFVLPEREAAGQEQTPVAAVDAKAAENASPEPDAPAAPEPAVADSQSGKKPPATESGAETDGEAAEQEAMACRVAARKPRPRAKG